MNRKPEIVIIGAGLAGLLSSIQLVRAGFPVTVIEKKIFPFHRVCGEYISNETKPFLNRLGIVIDKLEPSEISLLKVTASNGTFFQSKLDLGGFGISRYTLDNFLYELAQKEGVHCIQNEKVSSVTFDEDQQIFDVKHSSNEIRKAEIVIGSFGKRSNLDQQLNRDFFKKRSPYIGVKYHIKTDFPTNLIQLDNFKNGYCGIVKIESDKYCLCYLSHRDNLKKYGNIDEMEREILYKNSFLKYTFLNSEFIYSQPEVINEISFERKSLVENHILMCGDSAGMITPLCGNGMAMAIHSSYLLSECIAEFAQNGVDKNAREKMETTYQTSWEHNFAKRLKYGRAIQKLFGNDSLTNTAIRIIDSSSYLKTKLISLTHGKPF